MHAVYTDPPGYDTHVTKTADYAFAGVMSFVNASYDDMTAEPGCIIILPPFQVSVSISANESPETRGTATSRGPGRLAHTIVLPLAADPRPHPRGGDAHAPHPRLASSGRPRAKAVPVVHNDSQ
jgi:hypothetical protein